RRPRSDRALQPGTRRRAHPGRVRRRGPEPGRDATRRLAGDPGQLRALRGRQALDAGVDRQGHPRHAGRNRGFRSSAAETSDTSTPTGKISAKVIGRRNSGSAYWTLKAAISAVIFAIASSLAPFARALSTIALE